MKARLNIAAIYAARNNTQIRALPAERSDFCGESCYAARGGDPSRCDGGNCWALSVGASSRLTPAAVYVQRRLDLERGRTPAPRPRSLGTGRSRD